MKNEMSTDKLHVFLKQFCDLSAQEWMLLKDKIVEKTLYSGEDFIKIGQICNHIAFLEKGITRVYYIIEGKEITSYFNCEIRNQFVCSFSSFLKRETSYEAIQAIQDTQLLLLHFNDLQQLYQQGSNFQKLGRLIAEHNYLLSIDRIRSLQFEQASDRYENFIKIYPQLINQIPHHFIASYLGVTPESLSRIRKKAVKK